MMPDDVPANVQNDEQTANENAAQTAQTTKPTPKGKKGANSLAAAQVEPDAPQPDPAVMTAHGDVGLVTQPEHALSLIKGKATQIHTLVHNIGTVASAPLLELEALVAEMQFLFGVIRKRI